jgi:hypothetical protein
MAYSRKEKEDIFSKIIKHIKNGMSLRKALKQFEKSPRTIWDELVKEEDKNAQYAHACEERAMLIFEEALEIADKFDKDVITDEEGNEIINHNVINRDRLRIDTRKWFLSKMMPKKYGEKLQIDSNNTHTVKSNITALDKEEQEKIQSLLEKFKDESN